MNKQLTDKFKIQAVKQVTEQDCTVASVSKRLEVSTNSLYNWMKKYGSDSIISKRVSTMPRETCLQEMKTLI